MRDGVYKVTLESGGLKGLMIGTLHDGLLTGCDPTHHATGRVVHQGSRIKGTIVMRRHAKPEGFVEIANLDVITVSFAGVSSASYGQCDAAVAEKPGLKVKATFQWMCDF